MAQPINDDPQDSELQALTSIHGTYTLAATDKPEVSEVDRLKVKHFEETLAEIAMAVSSRKLNNKE
jgi:hypothetical protein